MHIMCFSFYSIESSSTALTYYIYLYLLYYFDHNHTLEEKRAHLREELHIIFFMFLSLFFFKVPVKNKL